MTPLWETPAPAVLPRALRPFVSAMHGYAASGLTPDVHRGLPGRSLTLVLALVDPLAVAPSGDAWRAGDVQTQWSTLGGLHSEPAYVVQPGRWAGVQLDLHPLGARRLLGLPASALPLDRYDARDLLGDAEVRLHDRLQAATSWDARYAVVTGFLLDRLATTDDRPRVRREVVEAWRWLGARRGAGTVTELSDHLGLGRRRLAQLFGGEVGVTPKTAARLMRFDAARRVVGERVSAGEGLDLTGVAVAHGYYDHAHLVREFTEFTGLSPTAWVRAEVANVQAAVRVEQAG
ncbi:helix-turn-helix domain-containing protein [Solicola sp. PLA-1-18]|uniref:AraC family transcriptional regulator n=1 Tax=Solicola sp. PLA-1-18 TaxID=3380532 RepID=UPI003B7CC109